MPQSSTTRVPHTILAYAWDVAELAPREFLAEVKDLGLDTVSLAGAYHAGKFLRPHGRAGRVYFPEDGTICFHPDMARYGAVKPQTNSVVAERDVMRELADDPTIAATAWMVLLHNSRLGRLHPDLTVRNAFGDRYVYSLCPAAPDVREFAVALCRDVTDNYAVAGLSLETPGFLPFAHGYHHEFALVKTNPWLENALGLCFCDHCREGASRAGMDLDALQARVAAGIDSMLEPGIDLPADMASAFWLADVAGDAELAAFLRWRCDVVTSLVAEIRAAVRADAEIAVIPSVARPTAGAFYEGTDLAGLAAAGIVIEACVYEPDAGRAAADIWDIRRRIGPDALLRGILRPAFPDLASRGALESAAAALRGAGAAGIGFYNYGHLRRESLALIPHAVAAFDGR